MPAKLIKPYTKALNTSSVLQRKVGNTYWQVFIMEKHQSTVFVSRVMNMHFISVVTDLSKISLGSNTLKAAFWKPRVKYHWLPGAS